jgi:hypothetical protein
MRAGECGLIPPLSRGRAGRPAPQDLPRPDRRAVIAAIRAGGTRHEALARETAKYRTVVDRNRHRARNAKSLSSFPHATSKDTLTRIAPDVITMANSPA